MFDSKDALDRTLAIPLLRRIAAVALATVLWFLLFILTAVTIKLLRGGDLVPRHWGFIMVAVWFIGYLPFAILTGSRVEGLRGPRCPHCEKHINGGDNKEPSDDGRCPHCDRSLIRESVGGGILG